MQFKRPRVSPLFLSAVDEIKQAGVALSPDEYIWLNDAANNAINGHDDGCPAFMQMPVRVGNCVLYPKTIGSSLWWENYASKWYGQEPTTEMLCIAFMLAHAKQQDVFESLTSRLKTNVALIKWQVSLSTSCTMEQLAWGVDKVLGQYNYQNVDSPNEVKIDFPKSIDWGDIIARLCAIYNQKPEFFIWNVSEKLALDMLAKAPSEMSDPSDDPIKKRNLAAFFEIKRHLKTRPQ